MEDGKVFQLEVVTPMRYFYTGPVTMVEFTTTEGDIGVLPGHIPLTCIAAPGILRIHTEKEIHEAALMDGIVRIMPDGVTILAEACEWPDEIDIVRANEAKIRAERRLKKGSDNVNLTRAEIAFKRSLMRIELASLNKK